MLRRSVRLLSRTVTQSDSKIRGLPKAFSTETLTVKHDSRLKLFYVILDTSKEKAVIEYEPIDDNTLDLYHTEVPPVFQGLGVAKVLAKAAFEHCVKNSMKMKLSCDYLQKYYRDNPLPEYASLVID